VHSSTGRATGVEDFLWDFLDKPSRTTSGRPVGVAVGLDGAVYISDDYTGNIYRVRYIQEGM
jgi:glucose/arabinose dehydrogenase